MVVYRSQVWNLSVLIVYTYVHINERRKMYRNLYLAKEENEWVKENGEGVIRTLIQEAMGTGTGVVPKINRVVAPKISGKAGDGLHTCKQCGFMLPFYKGKCKQGCK
jgi:hypothetical protein